MNPLRSSAWWMVVALVAALIAGALFVRWSFVQTDQRMRRDLLDEAQLLAQTINPAYIRSLTGSESDLANPEYRRLKDQLMAVCAAHPEWRFVYVMGRNADGDVIIHVDSEPEDSEDYSPPGEVYEEASPELRAQFATARPLTEGPLPDRWGIWISSYAPIIDSANGVMVGVVGIDRDAAGWKKDILHDGLIPLLTAGSLVLMLLAGLLCRIKGLLRYLEPGLALAIGFTLTAAAAWIVHRHEARHRTDTFISLARSKTTYILEAFHNLRDLRVEAIARFFEGSEDVTQQEFRQFASYLARIPEVRVWCWVSPVPASEKETFEAEMRAAGLGDFAIWQRDGEGHRAPVAGRDIYYPVTLMEPAEGRDVAFGYDIGSESVRRVALMEAIERRLVVATDPIRLVTDHQPGALVFRPVYVDQAPDQLRGLAMAVLDFEALLNVAAGAQPGDVPSMHVELVQWRHGEPPISIASTRKAQNDAGYSRGLVATRPVFAFGKTYAVVAEPHPIHAGDHPLYLGWYMALAGAALTVVCAFAIGLVMQGRRELERLVAERTSALQASIERYDQLAAHSRTVTWEVDCEGLYTFVSKQAEDVWGYRPGEIVGIKHFYDLHPEEGREAFRDATLEIARRHEPFLDFENPIQTKSGRIVWVSTHGLPMFGDRGQWIGYRGVDRDITERKAAEAQLRDSEAYIKTVLDNLPIGIAVNTVSPVVRFEYMNDNFPRFYRTTREALMSCPDAFWEVVYEDPVFREAIKRRVLLDVFSGDASRMHWEDIPITRRGGKTTYITARNIPVPERNMMISVVWDVTVRKQAEAERDRIFTAMEQASESIIVTDENGIIQYVNKYFETVSGYAKQEVLGHTPRILKSAKQDDAFYEELWRTITAGQTWTGRLINRRKDGTEYQEEAVITPVRDTSGAITNFVAVKRDVTREDELKNQLMHAQKMESIGLMAGGIAHDFNNILTVILGNANILQRSLAKTDAHQYEVEEIANAAMRAAEMTRQLLSFSRKQGGQPRLLDLNGIVRGLEKMLKRLLPESIQIEYRLREGELPVYADAGQMEQILLNLIVNARDAIDEHGVIIIESAIGKPHAQSGEIYFDAFDRPDREMAVICVRDNGVGIDPVHVHRIFEPFFTTKAVGKGTGLGLPTVFGIVKQHEGTLSVQSNPGMGSTFRIYLPLADGAAAKEESRQVGDIRGGGETLLVIEDDPGVRQVTVSVLEELGYNVIQAGHGAAALEIARNHEGRIDLVLTDIIMPGMSGVEVAAELKQIRPGLPVLYASGYPADHLERSGMPAGEFGMVQKPFSREALARSVRMALGSR